MRGSGNVHLSYVDTTFRNSSHVARIGKEPPAESSSVRTADKPPTEPVTARTTERNLTLDLVRLAADVMAMDAMVAVGIGVVALETVGIGAAVRLAADVVRSGSVTVPVTSPISVLEAWGIALFVAVVIAAGAAMVEMVAIAVDAVVNCVVKSAAVMKRGEMRGVRKRERVGAQSDSFVNVI